MKTINYIRTGLTSFLILLILMGAFLFTIIQPVKVADENFELEKARYETADLNYKEKVEGLKDSIEQAQIFMGWTYTDMYNLQTKLGLAEKTVYKGTFELSVDFPRFFEDYLITGNSTDRIRKSLRLAEKQAIEEETHFFEQWQAVLKQQNIQDLKKNFIAEEPIFAGKKDEEVLQILEAILKKGKEETIDLMNKTLDRYENVNEVDIDLKPISEIKITAYQDLKPLESSLMIYPKVEFVELETALTLVGSSTEAPLIRLNEALKDTTPNTVDVVGPLFEKMSVMVNSSTTVEDPFRGIVALEDTAEVMQILNSSLAKELLGEGIQFIWGNDIELTEEGKEDVNLFALNRNGGYILVRRSDVEQAFPASMGEFGFGVNIQFKRKAALKWKRMTERNINRCIAIVVDNKVLSAPRVNEPIANGNISISGGFSATAAADIAYSLTTSDRKLLPLRLTSAQYEKEDLKQKRSWWSIIYILLITSLIGTLSILGISYIITKVKEGYK